MIKFVNVSKQFEQKKVLKNINIEINSGDFVALTGINGAGKTTLVNLLIGSLKPTSGEIRSNLGLANFGLQIQDVTFNLNLKPKDYIRLQQDIYNISNEQVDKYLMLTGVDQFLDLKIKKLSGGQKQRLNILLAIIHDPKVMIFDELTTGLDALSRYQMRDLLRHFNQEGKTIILVSHYMDEIEDLCTRLICLKNHQVETDDTIQNVLGKYDVVNLDQYFKLIMLEEK